MNWAALLFIPQLIPMFVQSVEKLKGPGNGAEKKAAVKDMVLGTVVTASVITGQTAMASPQTIQAIDAMIDATVAVMNASRSVVKPSTPAVAAAP